MKKILAFTLVFVMIFSFSACNVQTSPKQDDTINNELFLEKQREYAKVLINTA